MSAPAISRAAIARTYEQIKPWIRKTPVIDVALPGIAEPVTLKLELLQHTASFKARGAFANLLGTDIPPAGVVAASGGNHGAAVAYAARALGVRARIFVPEISAPAKIARIRSYGADVVVDGENYAAALVKSEAYVAESGAHAVHAYDSIPTLLGQGTTGQELENQAPDIDTVLVAVGGGGFIGGIAAWFEGGHKVVGVEPETCAALHAALNAGEPTTIKASGIAADSLGASRVGELMFPIARRAIERVVLVSDPQIVAAQAWLWNDLRIVSEPGGAASLAALLYGAYVPEPGERVAAVLCGGNTDLDVFAGLIKGANE